MAVTAHPFRFYLFILGLLTLGLTLATDVCARNPDVSSWLVNLSSGSSPQDNADRHLSPEIVVIGDTVHAVWVTEATDGTSRHQVWYRRSLDGGTTWMERIMIAEGFQDANYIDTTESYKRLTVSGTTVHIAFTGSIGSNPWYGTLSYARSTDNGASFEATRILSQEIGCTLQENYITSEGNNVSIVIRLRSTSGYKRDSGQTFQSSDNGATFTQTQAFLYYHNDPPYAWANVYDLARQGDTIYVLYSLTNGRACGYTSEEHMYLAASTNGGTAFSQTLLSVPYAGVCTKTYNSGLDPHYVSKLAMVGDTVSVVWTGNDAAGAKTVLYRRSVDKGATFADPFSLFTDGGGVAIKAGLETVQAAGNYVYTLWATTNASIYFRASQNGGLSFQDTQTVSAGGWYPLINLDPTQADGATARLFWQGTMRPALAGGMSVEGTRLLFPFFRTNAVHREQAAAGPDGSLHYVMGGLFYSTSLCGGLCRPDIFYRRYNPTPPAPTQQANLRTLSERVPSEERFDNMQVPAGPDTSPAGALTVELWVKPAEGGANTGTSDNHQPMAFKPYGTGTGYSYDLGTVIAHDGGSPVSNRIITAGLTTTQGNYRINQYYADKGYVPYGVWSHLAMTYNPAGGANNFALYLNGTLVEAMTVTGTIVSDGQPFEAGHYGNLDIDNLRIWNKALTATELQQSMRSSAQTAAGLVANYPMDGTTKDVTGRGNHGILMFKEAFVPNTRPIPTSTQSASTLLLLNQ